jgi:3-hydroxyisobutyrate dehydrogenase
MKVGFAGLGLMGFPMAANLLRAGFEVAAYNRSAGPRDALKLLGARTFERADDLFEAADCVILMLADDGATDAVLGRGSPEFRRRVEGRLIVNMGTHAPAWSQALQEDLIAAGARFVEAPVSGSRGPAEAGKLVAMVAGDEGGIEQLEPLFAHLCRQTVRTGAVPSAMACKMSVNLYLIASVAALAEAARMAGDLGVEPSAFAQVMVEGPLGSEVVRAKLAKMMSGDFAAQATIGDVCKNADLVLATAAGIGLDASLLASARERFEAVLRRGGAGLDMAAVITAFERGSR